MLPSPLLLVWALIGISLAIKPSPTRLRRQLEFNASVPYIFSARLYPFGADRGDLLVHRDIEPYALEHPVTFLGEQYDAIYIRRDGSIAFRDGIPTSPRLPAADPTIAVFWSANKATKVMYRETDDVDIINLAHNEVNIQYRYGARFRVRSVLIVTWENEETKDLFQLALIIGDNLAFAHYVYSHLTAGVPAFAGFSGSNYSYSLPDAGTPEAFFLGERSDIGIPGEWLFQVNYPQIFLCGAGYRGLECVESCTSSQWSNDCHRSCHCDGGDPCDQETGRCPSGTCSPGWAGPACEDDVDECLSDESCPPEQPDCVNTAGAFLCLCFEYDEDKKTCKGAPTPKEVFEVPNVPMRPSFGRGTTTTTRRTPPPRRFPSTTTSTKRPTTHATTPLVRAAAVLQEEILPVPLPTSVCDFCHKHADCTDGQCKCRAGWIGDGLSCVDVDECKEEGVCGENAICQNTQGSFDCDCLQGFTSIQGVCQDVDECLNQPCGHSDGVQCINEPGTYRCECKEGFDSLNDCKDVDECKDASACGPNARCTNIVGGFECECISGYERLSEGANCTDINECMIEPCHPAAKCINEPGSFDCKCIDGFVGDGLTCHEMTMYPIANDSVVVTRAAESSTAIALSHPIKFFGTTYSTVFVSSNGIISFDSMVHGLIENPTAITRPLVLALHTQMDYAREGLVAYTFVNESDETAYSILTRSSVAAETQFGFQGFRPKYLHVFTYDKIRQAGSGNMNSFQVVFAVNENITLLTMIYDKVEAKGALAGVFSAGSAMELPSDALTSQSNVGRPGRWMMIVDTQLEPCPAGRLRAPLCDQDCSPGRWGFGCQGMCHCAGRLPCDLLTGHCSNGKCDAGWGGPFCNEDVDECATGIVICGENSQCVNSQGGYECRCLPGYMKNGTQCQLLDPCFQRFGRTCSSKALCQVHDSRPTCVCQEGMRGDGFTCEPRTTLPVVDLTKEIFLHSLEGLSPVDEETAKEVGEKPFVMETWVPSQTPPPTRKPLIVTAPPVMESTKAPRNITIVTEAPENLSNLYLWFGLPGVLCVIWIVLIIVIMAMWKKRRSNSVNDFDKVWAQPTRSTTTTRSAGTTRIPITNQAYNWRY